MSHDDHWCAIDPCEDCQREERERDRYNDELGEKWEREQYNERVANRDPLVWALQRIEAVFRSAR